MATKIFFCFAWKPGGYHVILGDLVATKLVGFPLGFYFYLFFIFYFF